MQANVPFVTEGAGRVLVVDALVVEADQNRLVSWFGQRPRERRRASMDAKAQVSKPIMPFRCGYGPVRILARLGLNCGAGQK